MPENNSFNNTTGISYSDYETINDIRNRLLDTILIWIVVLGAPVMFFIFMHHLSVGGLPIILSYFIVYLACATALFLHKYISYKSKTLIIFFCTVIVGIISIFKWGLIGMGIPFFIFSSILITLFLGMRSGIIITVTNLITISISAILFHMELLHYDFSLNEYALALPSWITAGSAYIFFTTVLFFSLGRMYYFMNSTIEKLKTQTFELQNVKENLEKEIQGRKQAEKALQESEENFQIILESLPGSVFIHDLEGKNLIVNDEACRVMGYSREELLDKTVQEAESEPFDMDNARKRWQQLVETGESIAFETKTRRSDGLIYNLEVRLKSIILQGQPVILVIAFDITERKQAETALRESEETFRTVLENLPGCVSVHDLEGRHLMVNEETCTVNGYTREELLNMNIAETAHPDFHLNDAKQMWQRIESGKSFTFDTLTRRKDGSLYDSEVHLTKIMLGGQAVILSLVFDITERKKTEENLARLSELERMISGISSGFVGMVHDEIDTYINEALASIGKKTGVDHAYLALIHPDGGAVDNINEWCADNTVPQLDNLKNIHPDKDFPWFSEQIRSKDIVHIPNVEKLPSEAHLEKSHFRNRGIKSIIALVLRQGENLIGLMGFDAVHEKKIWSDDEIVVLRIIGETFSSAIQRKHVEEEQEKLQVQLATAVDLAHLGPWELDIEDRIFILNEHFYRIYHTTAEEMGGYTMTSEEYARRFVHPDDIHLIEENLKRAFEPEAPVFNRDEHRMFYADGTLGYVMVQMSLVKNSKGIPVKAYGVNQDITEWKSAQEKLRESEEKLARSKKMESLGLLAGGVAHDLNNVLSGIVSYPELLLMDLPEDSKIRKPIETIQKSGEKAVAIVQDLLTIARGAVTIKEPLNLNDIIDEYLSSPEFIKLKVYHSSININTDLYPDLFNIRGSQIHIKKVIMNLVSNASEAIEGKGVVTISTSNIYLDKPISRYEDVKTGEYIVLSVSDNGPGIAPNNLERIFEPFFTKKVMGVSGTGLGLTVVWNIVQDHSGYIDVISNESGTKFDLYFPITRDELLDKTTHVMLEEIKGRGEDILVIDDVENQREISCKMLDILGYRYVPVVSGEEAIAYLKENRVNLILLDMIMEPGISGRETYEQIVKIHPKQKAVIVSGFSQTEDVVAIQKLGAGQYIKKPFTLTELGTAIKEELKKGN
jgi:PAS domain S-box-containing protein